MGIMRGTVIHFDLSHMDSLGDPAAIQWSRLIISCTTQDASPNEPMIPAILMTNRQTFRHSFGLILPAISWRCYILLCLYSIALWNKFIESFGQWDAENTASNVSNAEILSHEHYARDLDLLQSFAYGFSGWPRCNPMKHNDNILYHTRREPKRIYESGDIDENLINIYT